MLLLKTSPPSSASITLIPNDLIPKVLTAKHAIQDSLHIMTDSGIEVNVQTPSFSQEFVKKNRCVVEPA